MKFLLRWRLARKRWELRALLSYDKEIRSQPGATGMHLPDQLVQIGHEIAVLRYEIKQLKGELNESDPPDSGDDDSMHTGTSD